MASFINSVGIYKMVDNESKEWSKIKKEEKTRYLPEFKQTLFYLFFVVVWCSGFVPFSGELVT